jgi:hypothetical protein
MDNEICQRFSYLVFDYLETTPTGLAKKINLPYNSLTRIFRNKEKPIIPSSQILALVKQHFPEIDLNWLFTGVGSHIIKTIDPSANPELIEKLQKEIEKKDDLIGSLAAILRNFKQ